MIQFLDAIDFSDYTRESYDFKKHAFRYRGNIFKLRF